MEMRSWPANQRSAHYQEQAAKLRDLAARESAVKARSLLLALADQYQDLADGLKLGHPAAPA